MPLLPLAGGRPPPAQQHPARRHARRLLLVLLAFCALKAAWDSQSLLRAWRRGSGQHTRLAGEPRAVERAAAPAFHTVGNAVGAKAAAAALGSALTSQPALTTSNTTSLAAAAPSHAASQPPATTSNAASQAAAAARGGGSSVAGSDAAGQPSRPAVSFAWEERPDGPHPPAELLPAVAEAASNDTCAQVGGWACMETNRGSLLAQHDAWRHQLSCCLLGSLPSHDTLPPPASLTAAATPQALGSPKVALLFLTRGTMHHEEMWRLWLASAAGQLPLHKLQACQVARLTGSGRQGRRCRCRAVTRHMALCACSIIQLPCCAIQPLQAAVCTAAPEQYQALQHACAGPQAEHGSAAATAGGERVLDEEGSVQLPTVVGREATIEQQHLFSVYVHAPPSFPGKLQIHFIRPVACTIFFVFCTSQHVLPAQLPQAGR